MPPCMLPPRASDGFSDFESIAFTSRCCLICCCKDLAWDRIVLISWLISFDPWLVIFFSLHLPVYFADFFVLFLAHVALVAVVDADLKGCDFFRVSDQAVNILQTQIITKTYQPFSYSGICLMLV